MRETIVYQRARHPGPVCLTRIFRRIMLGQQTGPLTWIKHARVVGTLTEFALRSLTPL